MAYTAQGRQLPLKHYGDVIKAQCVIHFVNCADQSELGAEFGQIGLAPRIEISPGRFALWKPDDALYSTKSTPQERVSPLAPGGDV